MPEWTCDAPRAEPFRRYDEPVCDDQNWEDLIAKAPWHIAKQLPVNDPRPHISKVAEGLGCVFREIALDDQYLLFGKDISGRLLAVKMLCPIEMLANTTGLGDFVFRNLSRAMIDGLASEYQRATLAERGARNEANSTQRRADFYFAQMNVATEKLRKLRAQIRKRQKPSRSRRKKGT